MPASRLTLVVIASILVAGAVALPALGRDAANDPGARPIAAKHGKQRTVRSKATKIKGRQGYAHVFQSPRGIRPERYKEFREEFEEANPDNKRHRKQPKISGPHTPAIGDTVATDPLLPGRLGDARSLDLPAFPAEGQALPKSAKVSRSAPAADSSAAGDFVFYRNQPVAQGYTITGSAGEPTFANDGNAVLYTGNWHAGVSADNGINWDYLDPSAQFPSANNGFCCDQVAHAADHGDQRLIFWLLQYEKDSTSDTIRLVTYQGKDELLDQVDYCTKDFTPANFNFNGDGYWFDYEQMASTDKYLYISTNVYRTTKANGTVFKGGVIARMSLAGLDSDNCAPVTATYWPTAADYSSSLVEGAVSTMYWAYHGQFTNQLEIWHVSDSSSTAINNSKIISSFEPGGEGSAHCATPAPNPTNPCGRSNTRIGEGTGWIANGVVGWMWNVAEGGGYSFPHIRVARFNTATLGLIDEPDIHNGDYAWSYGSIAPDSRGDLGLVLYHTGGGSYPLARAAMIDTYDPSWASLTMHGIIDSTDGTSGDNWGDYGAAHEYDGCPNLFGGAVWSMQGGRDDGDAEHRFVIFGRERDECSDLTVPRFELTPRAIDAPADRPWRFRAIARNVGPGRSSAPTIDVFLSRDAYRTADDIKMATQITSVPDLGPGDGAGVLGRAKPPGAAIGNFYVLVCANSPGGREIGRDNNCRADDQAVTIGRTAGDIAIKRVGLAQVAGTRALKLQAAKGKSKIPVRVGLAAGQSPPAGSTLQIYAADGATFTNSAKLLSETSLAGHEPGAFAIQTKLRAPGSGKSNRFHLIACIAGRPGNRPSAENCLPAVQDIAIKQKQRKRKHAKRRHEHRGAH